MSLGEESSILLSVLALRFLQGVAISANSKRGQKPPDDCALCGNKLRLRNNAFLVCFDCTVAFNLASGQWLHFSPDDAAH